MHAFEYETRPLRSALLGDAVLPVWRHDQGTEPGRIFLWEQRYWLSFARCTNHVEYRKKERARGRFQLLRHDWCYEANNDVIPSSADSGFGTFVFSTRMLVAWLATGVVNGWLDGQGGDAMWQALRNAGRVAQDGFEANPVPTSIRVVDSTVIVGNGNTFSVNVQNLVASWPSLPGEWSAMRHRSFFADHFAEVQ